MQSKSVSSEGCEKLPKWDWESDPVFEGGILRPKTNIGDDKLTFYDVQDISDDTKYSILGNTVLKGALNAIADGARVKIEYKGEVESPKRKGKCYHNFAGSFGKNRPWLTRRFR
jgi:hypothetical protein